MEASRVDTRVHKSVNTDESNEHDRLYRFRLDPCDHFSKFLHFLLLIKIISLQQIQQTYRLFFNFRNH